MKLFTVKTTPLLEEKLDRYIGYLLEVKQNPQAAQAVLDDYVKTRESLEKSAAALGDPKDRNLRVRKLKRINFDEHDYFLLFRITGDSTVEIVTMFHDSEDYIRKIKKEVPL